MPLQIAAKVDRVDEDYYRLEIAPLLNDPLIEFIGEIDETEKSMFLGEAAALLFPIDWPEPFGLAMIEAMAAGTPVIAFGCGSVPEIVENGITGFIVDDVEAPSPPYHALVNLIGKLFVSVSRRDIASAEWRGIMSGFTSRCCLAATTCTNLKQELLKPLTNCAAYKMQIAEAGSSEELDRLKAAIG